MQMRVDSLREALGLLQPAIPKKTALPVLKSVLIKDGQAIANDLEVMVVLDLPEAEGECLIPHRPAHELLKYVPGNELLSIEQSEDRLKFSWEGGKAEYDTVDPKEYPPLPEVKEGARGSVDGDILVPALVSVAEYCSTDGARPVLNGIGLSLGKTIEAGAGDGYRMAYKILPISFPAEVKVIIPARSVRVLGELWKKVPPAVPLEDSLISQVTSKRQIELAFGNGLMARFGRVTLFSKLIEGSSPVFTALIPKEPPLTVRVFAPDLERAVRRCAEVARAEKEIVRLNWSDTAMAVSAKSGEKGNVEAEVPVQTEGGAGKIAVNVSYLLDYLKGKEGLVSIGVKSPQDPILFRHGTTPLVVIMPMFVEW